MPTTTETVTLDGAEVVDLLVEIHAVSDVISAITGTDARLTEGMNLAAGRVFDRVFPNVSEDVHEIFYDAADAKAREIVLWLAEPKEEETSNG